MVGYRLLLTRGVIDWREGLKRRDLVVFIYFYVFLELIILINCNGLLPSKDS